MIASAAHGASSPLAGSTHTHDALQSSNYCGVLSYSASYSLPSLPVPSKRAPCLFLKDHISTRGYILILAESFRTSYKSIQPTLGALAEAVSRPSLMHMYHLTPFSLGSAVSNGVTAADALRFFEENSYDLGSSEMHDLYNHQHSQEELQRSSTDTNVLPHAPPSSLSSMHRTLYDFLTACMERYNQVRVVIEDEHTMVQCQTDEVAHTLLSDPIIRSTALLPQHESMAEGESQKDASDETVAVELLLQRGYFYWKSVTSLYPYFLLKNRAMAKVVAARSVVLGYPMEQQYDYEHDTAVRRAYFSLRSQTRPRGYQVEAVEAATRDGTLHSGCLLLPCGAGKTLVGVMLMCKVRKPTLVVCAGAVSVEQWKNQILDSAVLDAPSPRDEDMDSHAVARTDGVIGSADDGTIGGDGSALHSNRVGNCTGVHHPRRRGCDSAVHAASRSNTVLRSGSARIACLTGKQKDEITEDTDVVLTTYSMLVSAYRMVQRQRVMHQSAASASPAGMVAEHGFASRAHQFTEHGTRRRRGNPKEKLFAPYGLLLLDEVHVIPAEAFRESLGFIDAKAVIGLTATYVREDSRILDLFHLVGPKLYDIAMDSLVRMGYLAKVNCVEVHTPMTREFALEYLQRRAGDGACVVDSNDEDDSHAESRTTLKSSNVATNKRRRGGSSRGGGGGSSAVDGPLVGSVPALIMLAAANPHKMECVLELVERHLEHGAKILVFCDHLLLLHEYGKLLQAPVICGTTPHRERLMIFSDFQSTARVNVICISRVGDVSVNLPRASVVLQVSSHGGSRRQEAQRLGRILRPKEPRAGHGGAESKESAAVEAWFYSIVSVHTLETAHAARRTAFLVDQGYTCRVMEYVPHSQRVGEEEEESGGENATTLARERDGELQQQHHVHAKTEQNTAPTTTATRANIKNESSQQQQQQEHNNNHNSASKAAQSVKVTSEDVVVGDAVSIKAEAMHNELYGSRVLRRRVATDPSAGGRTVSLHMRDAWRRVTSTAYQLHLLSKVVSTWEMTFRRRTQSLGAQRLSGRDDRASHATAHDSRGFLSLQQPHTNKDGGEQSDEEVEVIAPRRDWRSIKKEWGGAEHVTAGSESSSFTAPMQRGRSGADLFSSSGNAGTTTLSLQQLVGASEDFVYHEL